MLVSGRAAKDNAPFRVVIGKRRLVMPFFRKVAYLSLAMYEAEIQERCVTKQAIQLDVRAVSRFKVANDTPLHCQCRTTVPVRTGTRDVVLTGRIFSGHLRSIVGSMTVEEIIANARNSPTRSWSPPRWR